MAPKRKQRDIVSIQENDVRSMAEENVVLEDLGPDGNEDELDAPIGELC